MQPSMINCAAVDLQIGPNGSSFYSRVGNFDWRNESTTLWKSPEWDR